jgi:hypothetical protein
MRRRTTITAAGPAGQHHAEPPAHRWRTILLRVAGAALLIAIGAIHLACT